MHITKIKAALHAHKDPVRAVHTQRYFKTAPGEYGEGDIFIGVRTPLIREVAKQFFKANLLTIKELLYSSIHEERFLALIILVYRFPKAKSEEQQEIFDFYMTHIDQVNNWDLVDTSAASIIGCYLHDKPKKILQGLARRKNLWHRRIAIVATHYFIKQGSYAMTIEIATLLRQDKEDLIQKAVGWMLREVGKKDITPTKAFLNQYASSLPRTMLRYALEKFPLKERQYYMQLREKLLVK